MLALRRFVSSSLFVLCFLLPLSADTNAPPTNTVTIPSTPVASTPSLYNFTVNGLDGKSVDLGQYRGHVVLVVNTASKCGFTPQYAGLEKLYTDYKDKGFFILAFPSNDFGHQEPGTSQEISAFCTNRFNITFPMFEKVDVKGPDQAPVYHFLTTGHGEPKWNFHKYLVDKTGQVIGEFKSQVTPESKELRDAIDAALKG